MAHLVIYFEQFVISSHQICKQIFHLDRIVIQEPLLEIPMYLFIKIVSY